MIKVFISYSSKDKEWVKNWLLPKLEAAGIQVHIDYRDFKVGVPSIVNMEEGVNCCDKTLLVLTPRWLGSDWTDFEAVMLQSGDPVGKKGTIVPLMLEKCNLPPRLSIFTYADFKDKERWRESLNRLFKQWGVPIPPKSEEDAGAEPEPPRLSLSRLPETMTPELVGRLVKKTHQGDIRKRDKIKKVFKEKLQGEHAFHVMQSYERFLAGKRELDILRLMGLFDRPASKKALAALMAEPVIEGVTDGLAGLEEDDIALAVSALRDLGLLAEAGENEGEDQETLDCHPLVREYFGRRLEQENPKGFRSAHERLYDFYRGLPEKEQPDTLEEMEPLFAAVAHGCLAGLHQRAKDEVVLPRIRRMDEHFALKKLGAFGADLAALSHFFHTPWSRLAQGLREGTKSIILGWAAFGLQALGRLREAGEPMKAALEMHVKNENWKFAAMEAGNLCELELTLGRVAKAVDYGRRAVDHADRSGDGFQKEVARTQLADALHQVGRREEATALFREAEEMQKKRQPEYRFLYSLRGYQYCDLLLGPTEPGKGRAVREVMERAKAALEISTRSLGLLSIALDHLTLGRVRLMAAQENNKDEDWKQSRQSMDRAVEGLRKSGAQHRLPWGLLARAGYFRLRGEFEKARVDLKETLDIAQAGGMKLFIADYHLEAARLALAEKNEERKSRSEEELRIAEKMVIEMGYLRREKEILEIKEEIRVKHLISQSKLTKQQAEQLDTELKSDWWKKNRSRFLDRFE
jgi:tetratricopeptide (TPR) repeat protein